MATPTLDRRGGTIFAGHGAGNAWQFPACQGGGASRLGRAVVINVALCRFVTPARRFVAIPLPGPATPRTKGHRDGDRGDGDRAGTCGVSSARAAWPTGCGAQARCEGAVRMSGAMDERFPAIEPYDSGMLHVGDGHQI